MRIINWPLTLDVCGCCNRPLTGVMMKFSTLEVPTLKKLVDENTPVGELERLDTFPLCHECAAILGYKLSDDANLVYWPFPIPPPRYRPFVVLDVLIIQ